MKKDKERIAFSDSLSTFLIRFVTDIIIKLENKINLTILYNNVRPVMNFNCYQFVSRQTTRVWFADYL